MDFSGTRKEDRSSARAGPDAERRMPHNLMTF